MPSARRPRPAVLLLLALSSVIAACSAQALAFTIGDCVNIPDGAEITDYESVDCDEPHDHEVFALPQHPDGEDAPYPGQDALLEFAQQRCDEAFEDYVGIDYASSALYLTALTPSEEAWTGAGDREIVCLLAGEPVDGEFTQLTGSKEGSGE